METQSILSPAPNASPAVPFTAPELCVSRYKAPATRCTHDRAELLHQSGEHFCPGCVCTVEYYDFDAEERGE